MHHLHVGGNWAAQIAEIRDAHSEDTNLIRFGNNFYRTCRPGSARFQVTLSTSGTGMRHPLILDIGERDFYIASIGGQPMDRYASTFSSCAPSVGNLDNAIASLAGNKSSGETAFLQRSLITFCVAESIRNDHLATALGQTFMASSGSLLGVSKELDLRVWWELSHQWGKASEAIYAILSPAAMETIGKPRASLNQTQRQVSEYIDKTKIPAHLQHAAATYKVLKCKQ